jgi:predicted dehydrogenase
VIYIDPTHSAPIAKYTTKTPAGFPHAEFPDVFITPEVHGRQMGFSVEPMYHFIECVRDGRRPLTNGEDGLLNTSLIVAAEHSARTGNPVEI